MKRLKCCVALLLSLVFGLSGVLQPFALYAETLDLAQEQPKVSQPANESTSSNVSADASGDQEESDSAAQDPSTPDSSEATDAEATSDEDSNKGADEASDEASDDGIEAPLAENSWRYVDGSLSSDLPDDYGANADFDGRAMHSMPKGATAQGIDVSEHNGTINWQSVKDAGIDFAILRVGFAGDTSGGRLDNYFKRNVSECERLGIPYGVYLYSYARNEDEAQAEARLMLSALKGHSPALPFTMTWKSEKQMPMVRPCGHHLTIPLSSHRSQRPSAVKLRQRGISPVFMQTLTGSRTTLPTLAFFLVAGASGLPSIGTEVVTMSASA